MSDPFEAAHFIEGFVAEAEEHLRAASAHLLSIEPAVAQNQPTPRQVRELFRSLHTIKGLAGMVGVDAVVAIAHAMETVLREADRASGRLAPGSIEPLLEGVRAIEQRVQTVERRQATAPAPAGLIARLEALRSVEQLGTNAAAGGQTTLKPEL